MLRSFIGLMSRLGIRAAHDKLAAWNGHHRVGDRRSRNRVGIRLHLGLGLFFRARHDPLMDFRNGHVVIIHQRWKTAKGIELVAGTGGSISDIPRAELAVIGM